MLGTYHLVFFLNFIIHDNRCPWGEKEINIHVHKNDCLSFISLNEHIGINMIIVE